MNFDLTEEQEIIVESVAKFVRNDSPVERFRKLRDTERGWDTGMWERMGGYGWLGVAYPEEQGGFGGSFVDAALILEQLGRGLVPEPYIASVILAGGLISRFGNDSQREAFLTPMIEGKTSLALAYVERQSRYNLNDCLTTVECKADHYTLQGEKTWVLNGAFADHIVVLARSAGGEFDEDGLSLFIVDGAANGLTRVSVNGMDGQRTGLLRFDSVELGPDRLLGEEGRGLELLEWTIDRGAAAACAEGQGQIQELLDRTVTYLKERQQFGVPIGSFQALQHRAADMFAETELCKSTTTTTGRSATASRGTMNSSRRGSYWFSGPRGSGSPSATGTNQSREPWRWRSPTRWRRTTACAGTPQTTAGFPRCLQCEGTRFPLSRSSLTPCIRPAVGAPSQPASRESNAPPELLAFGDTPGAR